MTDTMREKFEKRFSGIVWANITHKNCAWAGYQAAQADARALVGELVEVLEDAKATIEYHDRFIDHPDHEQGVDSKPIESALTKAQAFMEGK